MTIHVAAQTRSKPSSISTVQTGSAHSVTKTSIEEDANHTMLDSQTVLSLIDILEHSLDSSVSSQSSQQELIIEKTFSASEFQLAKQQAHDRMLQNLVRLASWESLPNSVHVLNDDNTHCVMPMWQSRSVANWKQEGDQRDLFAPITLLSKDFLTINQWLKAWLAEGVNEKALQRFAKELNNSLMNEALMLCYRHQWNQSIIQAQPELGFWKSLKQHHEFIENPALFLEQWGAVGHPIHPTIKAKMGIPSTEVMATAPEFKGQARLQIAALRRENAVIEGMTFDDYRSQFKTYFPEKFSSWQSCLRQQLPIGDSESQYVPLPVHPVQVKNRWTTDFNEELPKGLLLLQHGPVIESFASLSYRTVYPAGGQDKPFIKLPVAMRMTSVQRTVSPRSCQMGPRISKLLERIVEEDAFIGQWMRPLPEKLGLHLDQPGEIAKHYSVIFRNPINTRLKSGEVAIPVAALMAKAPTGMSLASHILTADTFDIEKLLQHFGLYIEQIVESALSLYLMYGITLEPHQQNSLLVVDSNDQPSGFIIRDFGGVRIHKASLEAQGYVLDFHEDPLIIAPQRKDSRDKLIHTLMICHIGALVSTLAQDFSCPSTWLWTIVRKKMAHVFDTCRPKMLEVDYLDDLKAFLQDPWPTKAFIKMRLENESSDLWTDIPNPLVGLN